MLVSIRKSGPDLLHHKLCVIIFLCRHATQLARCGAVSPRHRRRSCL